MGLSHDPEVVFSYSIIIVFFWKNIKHYVYKRCALSILGIGLDLEAIEILIFLRKRMIKYFKYLKY